MFTLEELKADVAELCLLCDQARRTNVKNILSVEIRRLETQIHQRAEEERRACSSNGEGAQAASVPAPNLLVTKKIATYAWDQSDKFAKVYATANGVDALDKEQVKCSFGVRSFHLVINDLNGSNHFLEITNLQENIVPEESYHKVKSDSVLIMMKKKKSGQKWSDVTKKIAGEVTKEAPKPVAEDPTSGIMDLMKKMYDEGDDDMKRTINKAWSESQEKKGRGGEMDF